MTLDKAALDNWIAGAYAPQDECLCPTDCVTCQQEAPGLYCCGRCQDEEEWRAHCVLHAQYPFVMSNSVRSFQ